MSSVMRRTEPASPLKRFLGVRQFTERMCQSLSARDSALQSMPDASPTSWHLAHTTWFFETFLLALADGATPIFAELCR